MIPLPVGLPIGIYFRTTYGAPRHYVYRRSSGGERLLGLLGGLLVVDFLLLVD
jgi:hypothetical protein